MTAFPTPCWTRTTLVSGVWADTVHCSKADLKLLYQRGLTLQLWVTQHQPDMLRYYGSAKHSDVICEDQIGLLLGVSTCDAAIMKL